VVELQFFERAQPGTFADWEMQTFSSAQLSNAIYQGPMADPDGDGVPNLVEFAAGANPLSSDAAKAALVPMGAASNQFILQYRQRKNLGDVTAVFEASTNLVDWTAVIPLSTANVSDLGNTWLMQATFPAGTLQNYYTIEYAVPGD
jgi:hypothetical protein